ncbi:MAG: hypothetical protein JWL81_142 [Verrucomicrobiales bacterium]|nr:hypothetical protein [Verrucomicrobiales bacterium]
MLIVWWFTIFVAIGDDAPVEKRVSSRTFPSVFQAWHGARAVDGADPVSMQAMHDLVFLHPSMVGLQSEAAFEGLAFHFTPAGIAEAKAKRAALLAKNPNLVLLAEIRYRDAPKGFIPEDAPWWKRDSAKNFIIGWPEGGYRMLDVDQPEWREQVARRAKAVMDTGVFDGIMLDCWIDGEPRLQLVLRLREAIGNQALVMVNSNDLPIPLTGPHINGLYMECWRTKSPEDWKRVSETLRWAETNLRAPRINCLETWFEKSRQDLPLMRAVTTLSLTHSNGYCLFADPNELPTSDHLHDWYDFWNKGLGQPTAPGFQRPDQAWERPFSNGNVVYNPAGSAPVTVRFDRPRRSRASGLMGTEHRVGPNDGDIFLDK